MDIETIFFLLLVALGALVQTITGFAMGLLIIGGVTVFGLAEIGFTAAVISLTTLLNTCIALRPTYRFIDYKYLINMSMALIPFILLGVLLLNYLSDNAYLVLRKLLGFVIVATGVAMMLNPRPFGRPSARGWIWFTGCIGGGIAGLYSAGGAALAYFMYRQPLELNVIRATLLSFFAVSTFGRSVIIGLDGQLNRDVLVTAGLSIPVVILVTMCTSRLVRHIPDRLVRKGVFALLVLIGGFLMAA